MDRRVFFDEKGQKFEFIIRAKFEIDNKAYVAMSPIEDEENLYILKIAKDKEGNEYLKGIDDDELNEAKEAYEELIEKEEDIWNLIMTM